MDNRLTLSVEESAQALGIGRTLAYRLVAQEVIPAVRLGGRWVVPKECRRFLSDTLTMLA